MYRCDVQIAQQVDLDQLCFPGRTARHEITERLVRKNRLAQIARLFHFQHAALVWCEA